MIGALALTTGCGPEEAPRRPRPSAPRRARRAAPAGARAVAAHRRGGRGGARRPALAVKIENSVDARPQSGLNAADVVWEEVVEGGITRFVAVYHSTLPPEIGPIRSVRPMDAAIAGPLHGLFAFSGGQGPFVDADRRRRHCRWSARTPAPAASTG